MYHGILCQTNLFQRSLPRNCDCRGRGKATRTFNWNLWKFNVTLLKDEVFTDGVKNTLKKVTENCSISYMEKWEFFKQEVKELAIERSSILNYNAAKEDKMIQ